MRHTEMWCGSRVAARGSRKYGHEDPIARSRSQDPATSSNRSCKQHHKKGINQRIVYTAFR